MHTVLMAKDSVGNDSFRANLPISAE